MTTSPASLAADLRALVGESAVIADVPAMAAYLNEPRRRYHVSAAAVVRPADVAPGSGRIGASLSAFAGAAVSSSGGASGYFSMLGGAMVVVLLGLWAVGKQIPGVRRNRLPSPAEVTR